MWLNFSLVCASVSSEFAALILGCTGFFLFQIRCNFCDQAPSEAEAECASLCKADKVNVLIIFAPHLFAVYCTFRSFKAFFQQTRLFFILL